jgi:hypothetical protein
MTSARPNAPQRLVLQRLSTDQWRTVAKLKVVVADGLLSRLISNGWVEQRGHGRALELKLTSVGLEALREKIPDYANERRRRSISWSEVKR